MLSNYWHVYMQIKASNSDLVTEVQVGVHVYVLVYVCVIVYLSHVQTVRASVDGFYLKKITLMFHSRVCVCVCVCVVLYMHA